MARHNREGTGEDQRGHDHEVSYQPDWLRFVKITRTLMNGRQSTKTLFRNPLRRREAEPGDRVRCGVRSQRENIDVGVAIDDPLRHVTRVRVTCRVPDENGREEEIEYTFEGALPAPDRRRWREVGR